MPPVGFEPTISAGERPQAPDYGRKHRPKHVQPTWNNKLIYIVRLVDYFHGSGMTFKPLSMAHAHAKLIFFVQGKKPQVL